MRRGIEVRVVDRGTGVAEHALERIFEPLEQAEELHTRTHQGVGLGLPVARMSARAMDGDVTLEETGPHPLHPADPLDPLPEVVGPRPPRPEDRARDPPPKTSPCAVCISPTHSLSPGSIVPPM